MIQPLNSIGTNCCGTTRKQSFGDNPQTQDKPFVVENKEQILGKKPSKAKLLAGYTATQFAAGAIVSGIFDGLTNLWRIAFKNKELMPLKEIGGRAAFMGAAFAVIGLVFTAIGSLMAKKNN